MHLLAAAPAGDLVARRRLREEHRGAQVHAVDLVEGLLGDLGHLLLAVHADAVGEDVEAAQLRRHLVRGRADALDVVRVHGEAERAMAALP